MTEVAVHAAALACILGGVVFARRPLPGAALWMLPPLPALPALEHVGAVEGWSPKAAVAAAAAAVDAAPLALTTAEWTALASGPDGDTAAQLDAIEADLRAELEWRIASALLWLGADLELEHTLASLADYPGDCALREEVLAHA